MILFAIILFLTICGLLYLALSDSFVHLTNEQREKELEDIREKTREIEKKNQELKNKL